MTLTIRARLAAVGFVVLAAMYLFDPATVAQSSNQSARMPVFEVDTSWPRLPNNWVFGIVSSVAVNQQDHVWVIHRPGTVPENMRDRAAPPVIEFDANGKVVNTWGGPGTGYDWPDTEHGIFLDHQNNIWITGSGAVRTPTPRSDDMILKFTNQGKFLMQIGGRMTNHGNADTKNVRQAAGVYVYPKSNEVFVSDGYGNRRVIVFDANTGAFKRMWGAFANKPEDAPEPNAQPVSGGQPASVKLDTDGPGSPQFSTPVHDVKISNDDIVYVADRTNRRIQMFTPEGKYPEAGVSEPCRSRYRFGRRVCLFAGSPARVPLCRRLSQLTYCGLRSEEHGTLVSVWCPK